MLGIDGIFVRFFVVNEARFVGLCLQMTEDLLVGGLVLGLYLEVENVSSRMFNWEGCWYWGKR